MTQSKASLFEKELQAQAEFHKVLAHPARLAILSYLAKTKTCITGDISAHFPLARTTINQHLAELKKIDLIKGEICGSKVEYCLNTKAIRLLKIKTLDFFNDLIVDFDKPCEYSKQKF